MDSSQLMGGKLYRVVSEMEYGPKTWAVSTSKQKCNDYLEDLNRRNPPTEYEREVEEFEGVVLL